MLKNCYHLFFREMSFVKGMRCASLLISGGTFLSLSLLKGWRKFAILRPNFVTKLVEPASCSIQCRRDFWCPEFLITHFIDVN